jgi:hypothetical protein
VTRSFIVICATGLIVALFLSSVTWVNLYLTVVAAEAPKCARRISLDGDVTGIGYFEIIALASVALAVLVGALGRGKRVRELLKDNDIVVFELASIRVTYGMFIIYRIMFLTLVTLGSFALGSVTRYNAIVKYCLATAAGTPSNVITTVSPHRPAPQQGALQNG